MLFDMLVYLTGDCGWRTVQSVGDIPDGMSVFKIVLDPDTVVKRQMFFRHKDTPLSYSQGASGYKKYFL